MSTGWVSLVPGPFCREWTCPGDAWVCLGWMGMSRGWVSPRVQVPTPPWAWEFGGGHVQGVGTYPHPSDMGPHGWVPTPQTWDLRGAGTHPSQTWDLRRVCPGGGYPPDIGYYKWLQLLGQGTTSYLLIKWQWCFYHSLNFDQISIFFSISCCWYLSILDKYE